MKIIRLFITTAALLFIFSCSNQNTPVKEVQLNDSDKVAVEAQLNADEAAMDSLEKAIQSQINGGDSLVK